MKDASIVIFDEAAANVNPENENRLQKAMEELTRDKTVILPLLTGILGGIPFVLLALKQQKFGTVTLMGQTWMSIPFGLVFGLIADFIMKSGEFKS